MNAPPSQRSGLTVVSEHGFIQWMLLFVQPIATINGVSRQLSWGTEYVDVAPGQYHLKMHAPGMMGEGFIGQTQIEIHPGHITGIKYSTASAFFIFQAGTMQHLGVRPWG